MKLAALMLALTCASAQTPVPGPSLGGAGGTIAGGCSITAALLYQSGTANTAACSAMATLLPASTGLTISTRAAGGTNAYGLSVAAPSGAANNYAGAFTGGFVGIGTATPSRMLSVVYDDNNFTRGISLQNTNTGTFVINGLQLLNSGGGGVGNFEYYPSNFVAAGLRNTVVFSTYDSTALSFLVDATSGGSPGNVTFGNGISGAFSVMNGTTGDWNNNGKVSALQFQTASNCNSSASPAVCGSASAGSVTIAAAATSKVVNTTAVTANSQIILTPDSSLGTRLGVTCNTTVNAVEVTSRSPGVSFTIGATAAPITNPKCISFWLVN